MVLKVIDIDFKEKVIEKSKEIPVIVDFGAQWCQPCLILDPILEELGEESKSKFILAKMNVDDAPETSRYYNIMSIPSVKMFKQGRPIAEFIGVLPKKQVKEWLDKNLEK